MVAIVATKTLFLVSAIGAIISTFWRISLENVIFWYTPDQFRFWTSYWSSVQQFVSFFACHFCIIQGKMGLVDKKVPFVERFQKVEDIPHSIPDHVLASLILLEVDGYFCLCFYRHFIKFHGTCVLYHIYSLFLFLLRVCAWNIPLWIVPLQFWNTDYNSRMLQFNHYPPCNKWSYSYSQLGPFAIDPSQLLNILLYNGEYTLSPDSSAYYCHLTTTIIRVYTSTPTVYPTMI